MRTVFLARALSWGDTRTATMPWLAFAQQKNDPASQEPTDMKIRMMFNGHSLTATLYDNPSARDFASMLPLELTIENYCRQREDRLSPP